MIKIAKTPNIYIEHTPNLDKYLTDGIYNADPEDKKAKANFKKVNKNPLKTFNLWVRVTKVVIVDEKKKQKAKKKLFKFDGTTINDAIKELDGEPEKLIKKFDEDAAKVVELQEQKEKEAEAEHIGVRNVILNDVWEKFYTHKTTGAGSKKWRDSTANNYTSFYNVWIRRQSLNSQGEPKILPKVTNEELGSTPITHIKSIDCVTLINDIVNAKKSLRTATTVIEVLRPMFDWYYKMYEIDKSNPVPSKSDYELKGEHDNRRGVSVSLAKVKKLYETIDSYDDDLFRNVFMWLRTGRRRNEVVTLQMKSIDTEAKDFSILAVHNKAKVLMQYRLRPELLDTLPEDYDTDDEEQEESYLFDSPVKPGQPIHVDSITKHWNIIKKKVGGDFRLNGQKEKFINLHLHDIRHIIGGVMKSAEIPEETRAKVLGHKRVGVTDRYGKHYYGDIDRAYQLFLDIVYGVVPSDTKWGTV